MAVFCDKHFYLRQEIFMKLKIMTYNIQHCLDYIRREINACVMTDVIKAQSADVCGLNEVRGRGVQADYTAQAESMAAILGMHSAFGMSALIKGKNPYGNAVLTKYPIMKTEVFPIERIADEEPRSVFYCKLSNGLAVYQSHFGLTFDEQEKAVDRVLSLIEKEKAPAVLMGDFNMTPDNPIMRRLYGCPLLKTAQDMEFTFPSDTPDRKIDYIFVNDKVKLLSHKVVNVVSSDHRPITAEIEF